MKDMISPKQYIENAKVEIRERWFKDHVIDLRTFMNQDIFGLTLIDWKKPDSYYYAVRYIIAGRCLYVSGDLGEAVYAWSATMAPRWLAGCSLEYFMEKCQASERGREFVDWSDEVARFRLNEYAKDELEELEKKGPLFITVECSFGTKDECEEHARKFYELTGESELSGMIHDAGNVPSMRAIAHWLGIVMINEIISTATQS